MKVTIETDDKKIDLFGATKIICDMTFDLFTNKIEIHQGEKKHIYNQFEINRMEIEKD